MTTYTYEVLKAAYEKARYKTKGKPIGRNTYAVKTPTGYGVRLHKTVIIDVAPDNSFTVNVDDWFTPTSNDRIRRYNPAEWFGGFYNSNGAWAYFKEGFLHSYYYPGMRFDVNGNLISNARLPDADFLARIDAAKKQAKTAGHTIAGRWCYSKNLTHASITCRYCHTLISTKGQTSEPCAGVAHRDQDRAFRNQAAREQRAFWKRLMEAEQVVVVEKYGYNSKTDQRTMTHAEFMEFIDWPEHRGSKSRMTNRYGLYTLTEFIAKRMTGEIK